MTQNGRRDPREFIEEVYRIVGERDLDRLVHFFAQDCVFIDMTEPEPAQGREALRAYMRETWAGLPDFRPETWKLMVDGNQVAAELELVGRHDGEFLGFAATGKLLRWPASAFYTLTPQCDQILREVYYYDRLTLTRQLAGKGSHGNG